MYKSIPFLPEKCQENLVLVYNEQDKPGKYDPELKKCG